MLRVLMAWWALAAISQPVLVYAGVDARAAGVPVSVYTYAVRWTVVGRPLRHIIQKGQTLLDIARSYDVGFDELQELNPARDPWIPPPGAEVTLPTQWILPEPLPGGIVVNTAELRLYYFLEKSADVLTFPVAIGEPESATPVGAFYISAKQKQPVWTVPPSLRYKYAAKAFPPGPDNPLGDHWLGLGRTRYGIHGSDMPWSVGRLVTHGCIRMYPEDISRLFDRVAIGTPVRIIYEPVKFGFCGERIFVEVHADIYSRTPGIAKYGMARLERLKLTPRVDLKKLSRALKACSGLPVEITRTAQ